jgi:hypothetical protein
MPTSLITSFATPAGSIMAGHGDADLHGGPRVGFVTPALAFAMLDSLAGRL